MKLAKNRYHTGAFEQNKQTNPLVSDLSAHSRQQLSPSALAWSQAWAPARCRRHFERPKPPMPDVET